VGIMEDLMVLFILSSLLGLWIETTSFLKNKLHRLITNKSIQKTKNNVS